MEEDDDKPRRAALTFLCGKTGLFLLVISYTLLGAVVFKALEGGPEGDIPQDVQRSREDCLRELWLITERLNVLYEKNWTKLVTEQLKRFEKVVVESGGEGHSVSPIENRWSFGGALLYTLTLLTTIGYGKLSPKTALGKLVAMVYALIGVPLMLVLLSLLGSMLANGAKIAYSKICCKEKKQVNTSVGFHKGPPTSSGKTKNDDCTIQILPHSNQNCISYKSPYTQEYHVDHQDVPKRAILATVRASHARGRCRQGQVRQMLADPHFCSTPHPLNVPTRSIGGPLTTSDVEEPEENEDNEHGVCVHDTPSRVPLIYRPNETDAVSSQPPPEPMSPPVPAILVLVFFSSYVCLGASVFATAKGWDFLDATYFCFVALSTIGIYDKLPSTSDLQTQLQLVACCLYLFLGLVVVAMCFTLVQDEMANRCRKLAKSLGFG